MLTQEQVNTLFHYSDGELIRISVISKKTKIGDVAGRIGKRGYKYLTFYQKKYYVHRIIWLMHYGTLPKILDHIDGNPLNNRIENLRECSDSENLCNAKIRSNNTSGIKGVCWFKPRQKWRARISLNKKEYHLGYFDTKEEAEIAVIDARPKIHQEFARNA
jgi:hypothetical protein